MHPSPTIAALFCFVVVVTLTDVAAVTTSGTHCLQLPSRTFLSVGFPANGQSRLVEAANCSSNAQRFTFMYATPQCSVCRDSFYLRSEDNGQFVSKEGIYWGVGTEVPRQPLEWTSADRCLSTAEGSYGNLLVDPDGASMQSGNTPVTSSSSQCTHLTQVPQLEAPRVFNREPVPGYPVNGTYCLQHADNGRFLRLNVDSSFSLLEYEGTVCDEMSRFDFVPRTSAPGSGFGLRSARNGRYYGARVSEFGASDPGVDLHFWSAVRRGCLYVEGHPGYYFRRRNYIETSDAVTECLPFVVYNSDGSVYPSSPLAVSPSPSSEPATTFAMSPFITSSAAGGARRRIVLAATCCVIVLAPLAVVV